jgi:hypothetical protein
MSALDLNTRVVPERQKLFEANYSSYRFHDLEPLVFAVLLELVGQKTYSALSFISASK